MGFIFKVSLENTKKTRISIFSTAYEVMWDQYPMVSQCVVKFFEFRSLAWQRDSLRAFIRKTKKMPYGIKWWAVQDSNL